MNDDSSPATNKHLVLIAKILRLLAVACYGLGAYMVIGYGLIGGLQHVAPMLLFAVPVILIMLYLLLRPWERIAKNVWVPLLFFGWTVASSLWYIGPQLYRYIYTTFFS